ncbi:hypothetical protein [Brachyspira murdochii]|uniref:Lipoprotein n=1 Tax=Brachyspira murdochii (strain ATCC 51284 / DSM 12563 / 56-150) TaxID=526224 RepID=D5U816_BRAM5|nr:hypothetical protein [Brachyspira murdochii]ADG70839.1 hypothetical protein Bmur_0740 [Brachyspira murdochii DSM 12563]
MKKNYFLFFVIISMFMMSCGGHFFNPRYYYNKSSSYNSNVETDTTPTEPPKEVSPNEDPFLVGDWNRPDYGEYDASIFDEWLFKSSFRGDKLPIYKFFSDTSKKWSSGGLDWKKKSADFYNPNDGDNTASGFPINKATIYKYNGENPLYDKSGYLEGRLDRFRFYSIYGETGGGIVTLQQYLIAVDTYSKFVFAFGKIIDVQEIMNDKVPMEFEAIEKTGNAFYEYDPIGYVDKTGTVVFYQHYKTEFVNNPTEYLPMNHGYTTVAEHNENKPGHSPYIPMVNNSEASEEDKNIYKEEIAKLQKEYKWRDYSGFVKNDTDEKAQIDLEDWRAKGYSGKSITLYKYTLTDNGETLNISQDRTFENTKSSTVTYKLSKINAKDRATYTNISDTNDSISISIVDYNGENTISVSGQVLDPNFADYGPIFVDRLKNANFKKDGEQNIAWGLESLLLVSLLVQAVTLKIWNISLMKMVQSLLLSINMMMLYCLGMKIGCQLNINSDLHVLILMLQILGLLSMRILVLI